VRRGHLDVDDRDVGLVRAHLQQEVIRGAALTDDFEPGVIEQPCDSFTQENGVVGNDDADARRLLAMLI
jgi:hypothetical protein